MNFLDRIKKALHSIFYKRKEPNPVDRKEHEQVSSSSSPSRHQLLFTERLFKRFR